MTFTRPTLQELISRSEGFIVSRLGVSSPVLRVAVARVFGRVIGAASHLLHGHISWVVKQIHPQTQDIEYLRKDAALRDFFEHTATFANITIVQYGDSGTEIPNGTTYARDDGVEYVSQSLATIQSGAVYIDVKCTRSGTVGNCDVGSKLELASPISGAVDSVTVHDVGIRAEGSEDEDDFRARYLEFRASDSLGGSDDDYNNWAREINGVTRVFVNSFENGLGTVVVRFLKENQANPIPNATEVLQVKTKILEEKPSTAIVDVVAPLPDSQDYNISITPDNSTARSAIENEIKDLIFRKLDIGDGSGLGSIRHSDVEDAVRKTSASFTIEQTDDYVPGIGRIAVFGSITWE